MCHIRTRPTSSFKPARSLKLRLETGTRNAGLKARDYKWRVVIGRTRAFSDDAAAKSPSIGASIELRMSGNSVERECERVGKKIVDWDEELEIQRWEEAPRLYGR